MTIQLAKAILLRCLWLNFLFLLAWSLATFAAHDIVYGLSTSFFRVFPETFDTVNFACIAVYKIGVLFFNIVPFIALSLVERSRARGA